MGAGPVAAALLAAAPEAVVVVDASGSIVDCNPSVRALLGYRPEELVGQPVEALVPDEVRELHVGHRAAFLDAPVGRPMGAGLRIAARRRDGSTTPVDISLAPAVGPDGPLVGAFIRDATRRPGLEHGLRAVIEVNYAVLAGGPLTDSLQLAAGYARELVGGDDAWVLAVSPADQITVLGGAGWVAGQMIGERIPVADTVAGRAIAEGTAVRVDDLSLSPLRTERSQRLDIGPTLVVPVAGRGRRFGSLAVTRAAGRQPFTRMELRITEVFAAAIAVAFALGESRADAERLELLEEHERIARELHDTVIQRLFATGMSLQATAAFVEQPAAARITDAIGQLDDVIRELRSAIFDLTSPSGSGDFRERVGQMAREIATAHGVAVRVAFDGPVDASVGAEVAGELIPLLREAVSNAARHAKASRIDVVVRADGGLTASVLDDGIGISGEPSAGTGMRSMADRAQALGGELVIRRRQPTGTVVECRLPAGG